MCWDHFAKFSFILLFMSVCEHPRAPIRIFTTTATDEKLSEYEHLSNLASVSFLKHQAFVNIGPPALGIGSNRSRDTDADSKRESLSQQKRRTPSKNYTKRCSNKHAKQYRLCRHRPLSSFLFKLRCGHTALSLFIVYFHASQQ